LVSHWKKQENLKRILQKFEEKKTKTVGGNRDDRRAKEQDAKKSRKEAEKKEKIYMQAAAVPEKTKEVKAVEKEGEEGFLGKMAKSSFNSKFMNEANDLSRSQALQLNSMLENAGMLPKIADAQNEKKDSGDGKGTGDQTQLEPNETKGAQEKKNKKKGGKKKK